MATPKTQGPAADPGAGSLAVELLSPSLSNPRRDFDGPGLKELAASIKQHGVIQPILVRPWPTGRQKDPHATHEIVTGERRWRAAKLVKLSHIPVVVRELSDEHAREIQIVENLQRADLHPLDEAEGYEKLLQLRGPSIDDLAATVGKSRAYVYARVKLLALCTAARKAFREGKLSASTALLVARIPNETLQREAVKEITKPTWPSQEGMSVRRAATHIQERYMLRLTEAPFAVADAQLVPEAGACGTCPKRTGNQKELFGDVKGADVCTDPPCFHTKTAAAWKVRAAEAETKGLKVLSAKERKRHFPYGADNGHTPESKSPFARLDTPCYEDSKHRTFAKMLGSDAPPVVAIVQAEKSGRAVKLVERKALGAVVRETLKKRGKAAPVDTTRADEKKRDAAHKREAIVRRLILEAILAKHPGKLSLDQLRRVALAFFEDIWEENRKLVFRVVGWELGKAAQGKTDTAGAHITKLKEAELYRLLLALSLAAEVNASRWSTRKPTALYATAKRYRIDPAKIRRELAAAEAEKKKKKPTAKKPAPKARRSSGKK